MFRYVATNTLLPIPAHRTLTRQTSNCHQQIACLRMTQSRARRRSLHRSIEAYWRMNVRKRKKTKRCITIPLLSFEPSPMSHRAKLSWHEHSQRRRGSSGRKTQETSNANEEKISAASSAPRNVLFYGGRLVFPPSGHRFEERSSKHHCNNPRRPCLGYLRRDRDARYAKS